MLSAIAARKAAQAARQNPNTLEKDTISLEVPIDVLPQTKSTSKRKSSTQNLDSAKRKKNEKRTPADPPREFTEDSFRAQQGVIIIESDGESLSEGLPTPNPTTSRRWSPSIPLNDSSDEEADTISFAAPPTTVSPNNGTDTPAILSTFDSIPDQNTFFLQPTEVSSLHLEGDAPHHANATVVALRPEETLCLLGTYVFSVLQGSIMFSGVTLSSSPNIYRVFAPRSAPLPVFEGIDGSGAIPHIRQLPPAIHCVISTPVALVLLQELRSGVEGLGNICRTFDSVFEPSRWQKSHISPLKLSGVHVVRSQTKDIQVFELSVSWRRALPSISPSNDTSIHLVKGPKKSGKSTFARTLVNTLLSQYQKVAYLECDIGQSEFTPGGIVALNVLSTPLFGPPFTHPTLPYSAHYVGAMTPRSSPSLYLAAVQAILETYRLDIQTPAISWRTSDADTRISDSIPLVVNTMGWNKGLGADLTIKLQEMIQPTDIYEIETPFDPAWPTPAPRDVAASSHPTRTHLLRPAPASILSANYSATDHRSLSIMSYFHVIFSNSTPTADEFPQTTGLTWHTSLPLCALPPYEVDCARSFDKVILTGAGTEDVVPSEIARVLNGSLVALVSCAPGTLDLDLDSETLASRIPYTQGCEAPSPALSRCLGLALVRSVSPLEPQTQMHVLTPLPPKLLSKCRVLVKGELELPIWGMLDYREEGDEVAGVESGKVPFLQWGKGEGVGGERRRIRRNLMRRAQM
ncbi:Polynucleotide 5'-hydroxyl-kinase GRC3 [Termitomyces sp. T112]|nr:Polynucleotide 5'-hydroxyl-kinase GRC3 [Termitomyces sp. T112]